MKQNSKVAIIGLGNIGTTLATNMVKGNRAIIIADRTENKAIALGQQLGSLAQPKDIRTAIQEAGIIVFAVYFDVIKELFGTYKTELQGKIIVDPSNPIAPDEKGGFKKIVGENESSGQLLSALLPEGAKLAKALGTLGVGSLSTAAFQSPEKAVEFYATDDQEIDSEIEKLICDNGFEPLKVGGLAQSIRIEVFGDLHEFGALGKPVTAQVAAEKL